MYVHHIYHIPTSYISYIYIYIYIYDIKNRVYKSRGTEYRVSAKLNLWFGVWVPLVALPVNFLGKYLFFN